MHLANVEKIDLSYTEVTDAGLAHLANVKEINLEYCDEVTNAGKKLLRARGVEIIE